MLWALPPKTTISMLFAIGFHLSYGWLLEFNYIMFQNEADDVCDGWLGDMEAL